jgi:hypothetical protein
MQFTRAAIIIQAVGNIAVLLHLQHRYASPDSVNSIGRNVEKITGHDIMPSHELFDTTI